MEPVEILVLVGAVGIVLFGVIWNLVRRNKKKGCGGSCCHCPYSGTGCPGRGTATEKSVQEEPDAEAGTNCTANCTAKERRNITEKHGENRLGGKK